MELFIEAQIREKRHTVLRAINTIERNLQKLEGNVEQKLPQTMFKHLLAKMEMAAVHSPSRAINMARRMGLRAGWALAITTKDDDGREWDFNQLEMRDRAIRKLLCDKPLLFIFSPMCTAFSQLNNINHCRMGPSEVQRRMEYGRRHLEFCMTLYNTQWS